MLFNKQPIYVYMHCFVPKPSTPLEIYSKLDNAQVNSNPFFSWWKYEYLLELHTANLCYSLNHIYARIADLYILVTST